jgi:hypothetical protein
MALFIVPNEQGAITQTWTADRKLWKTRDGRIVEDDDPAAAVLYAARGDTVPLSEARLYGLAPPPEVPDVKLRVPAQNKQRKMRDAQQKEREALRDQQAHDRTETDEPEEQSHG